MEAQKDPNALQENQIDFNPETEARIEDISLDLQNLEVDEGEVLNEIELNNRYEQFMNENEYQSLFEGYISVKKSNINEVYANPLYFIKKIIYFYNKETFLDPYFLYLKSTPNQTKEKKEKEKYISFEACNIKDNKEACLSLDLTKNKFDVMIKPDNKTFTVFFNVENNNINIPISNFDKGKNEVTINSSSKKLKFKGAINITNLNSVEQGKKKKKDSFNNNSSGDKNIQNKSNTNSSKLSNNSSKKGDKSSEFTSKENTLISYDGKNNDNLNIIIKENNDNLLLEFNKEKIGGEKFESIANKTFELMCNISLNRDIKVKTFTHKNPDKINSFFNINDENQINVFQIDTYIPKISGKEINKIYGRFPNNFLFFEELKINDFNNYEIIGEVSQNIVNNAKQKIAQEFNYIHLIKKFNNYPQKDEQKFIALCKQFGLNNIEKIFILFTDGSYIRIKFLINLIDKNKNEIINYFQQKKEKKEILAKFSKYFKENEFDLLEIDLEKFYNLCLFYNNLKSNNIKFCFCFISDVIEDKLENRIEEKIKLFINDDKDIDKNLKIEKEKEKTTNDFILKMAETIKKNDKLRAGLTLISSDIRRKIKEFADSKNEILNKLESTFNIYIAKNKIKFFDVLDAVIPKLNEQNIIQKIYLNKIFFFIIFLLPKENQINFKKIKEAFKNSASGLSFEIIQKDNKDDIDKYIKSKNIKNKICAKVYISNDEHLIKFLNYESSGNENEVFYFFKNNIFEISFKEIIKKNFNSAKDIYIKEFYNNNKAFLPELNERKEMLSQNNITKKIYYDLKLFGLNEEKFNFINLKDYSLSFKLNDKDKNDLDLLKIGDDYYNSLIKMIRNILQISKINKENNVIDNFLDKRKFDEVFIKLMENIKCKCFYNYFLFQYIKNWIMISDEFVFPKIILEDIIKKK